MKWMKHKKIISAVLAASMVVGSASQFIYPVFAKTDSDIEIVTSTPNNDISIETSTPDDVVISTPSSSAEDIQVSDGTKASKSEDIVLSGDDINITDSNTDINTDTNTDTKNSKSDVNVVEDVEIGDTTASTPSDVSTEDIVLDVEDVLSATVERKGKNKTVDTGVETVLQVKAENKSSEKAMFKLYFTNVDGELSDDKSTWNEYLTQPSLDVQVCGLDDACKLPVIVSDVDGNKLETSLEFLKEVKEDAIVSRYAVVELPAGTKVDFDLTILSENDTTVTVIPVMEQYEAVYGDDASVTWETEITFFDKVVNFFTGDDEEEIKVEEPEDIEITSVQGVEVDTNGIDDADFESMRLVIMTDDESVIEDKDTIIGQHDNVYLLQFGSVSEAKLAYVSYKDKVDAVEPDKDVEAATNDTDKAEAATNDTDKAEAATNDTDKAEATTEEVVTDEVTDNNAQEEVSVTDETMPNPIAALNDVETSTAKRERGVIALIDTGVKEHENVIDNVSVIEENTDGLIVEDNESDSDAEKVDEDSHGDKMVKAIVSQDAEAKILSIRALDDNGIGTISSLVAAMEYAIEQKVDYINLSLYARTTLTTSALKYEITKATDAGIIVIGAAGNDGADVKDYVPGSVEEAYVIGAVADSGYRLKTSNYGETVDYNVVADSTSEATALFTGYVSANGLENISDILNQGLIYATDYNGSDIDLDLPEFETEDFSEYTYDKTKTALVRYSFVESDKLKAEDTIDSLLLGDLDYYMDMMLGTVDMYSDVYAVGDGTYKFRADIPLRMGYVVGNKYHDVIFSDGNDDGHVIADGMSMDMKTGVVTVDESLMVHEDGDFSDVQIQVLVPITDIPDSNPVVTIENKDGSTYKQRVSMVAMTNHMIPLGITGTDEVLTSDDFEVYLNDSHQPSDAEWDEETHSLCITDTASSLIYSARIVVKKDVDAVFVAAASPYSYNGSENGANKPLFYLAEGTDMKKLKKGKTYTCKCRVGNQNYSSETEYEDGAKFLGTVISNSDGYFSEITGGSASRMGFFGIPIRNWFGLSDSRARGKGGAVKPLWVLDNGGTPGDTEDDKVTSFNAPIHGRCNHISTSNNNVKAFKWIKFKVIGTFNFTIDGKRYKGRTIACLSVTHNNNHAGYVGTLTNGVSQAIGGIFNIGVPMPTEEYEDFTVVKKWTDGENKFGTRPQNITVRLLQTQYNAAGNAVSTTPVKTATLTASNNWSVTWNNMIVQNGNIKYKYSLEEDVPAGYTVKYGKFKDISNTDEGEEIDDDPDDEDNRANMRNTLITGYLKLHKTSQCPNITDNNKCYSLAGAEYTVYTDAGCTQPFKVNGVPLVLVTDANGDTPTVELPTKANTGATTPITYYVKETKTSPGFEPDTNIHSAQILPGHTAEAPCLLTSVEPPGFDPAGILINKITSAPSTAPVPSLAGTQFTVKYYDGYYDASNLPAESKRTWIIEVKEVAEGKFFTMLSETYKVGGDALYYDSYGTPSLPYGTITIQETKAAPGYTLDGYFENKEKTVHISASDVYIAQVTKDNGMIALSGGNEFTACDESVPVNLKIVKSKSDDTPLAGVTYQLTDPSGNVVGEKTTDANGIAMFDNLQPNIYTVTETKTAPGYTLLAESFTVYAPMGMTPQEVLDKNVDTSKCIYSPVDNMYYIYNITCETTNDVVFKMPMSGGTFNPKLFIPLGCGMVLFTTTCVFVFRKKKKKA